METYKVKFHRISVYGDIDNIRYRIILDKYIPGYKIDADGQVFKTTINYIDILPSALIAQTIRCIPNLGIIHAYLVEKNLRETGKRIGINAAQLQAYLTDADVTLERTEFHPGEEYTTVDGKICIHKEEQFGKYVSFFSMGDEVTGLSLTGFQYPLDDYTLKNSDGIAVSNQLSDDCGIIEFETGYLMMVLSKDRTKC